MRSWRRYPARRHMKSSWSTTIPSDATRDVVEPFVASGVVRYAFEPCQGLSVARNHGVSVARADLIAFTDDDVRVSPTWVQSIVRAFGDNPDVDMVGGKVEPAWEEPPPPWLLRGGRRGIGPRRISASTPFESRLNAVYA